MPGDNAETQPPDLTADSIARQMELLARARVVAKRIAERIRKVTADDTVTDAPVLPPTEAPTTEKPPLA